MMHLLWTGCPRPARTAWVVMTDFIVKTAELVDWKLAIALNEFADSLRGNECSAFDPGVPLSDGDWNEDQWLPAQMLHDAFRDFHRLSTAVAELVGGRREDVERQDAALSLLRTISPNFTVQF